jgi:hypothetical protein
LDRVGVEVRAVPLTCFAWGETVLSPPTSRVRGEGARRTRSLTLGARGGGGELRVVDGDPCGRWRVGFGEAGWCAVRAHAADRPLPASRTRPPLPASQGEETQRWHHFMATLTG